MLGMPCRIALISDNEIVIHGLKAMLSPTHASVSAFSFRDYPAMSIVDITLIDVSFRNEEELAAVQGNIDERHAGAVVIFGWDISSEQAKKALLMGCRGSFNKSVSGPELISGLGRIHRGEIVVVPPHGDSFDADLPVAGVHSGMRAGLSQRESEVISMITWGRTNNEIAETLYLSVNTVKYYVRSAYRKIGVERRAQAVKWGIQSGMDMEYEASGDGARDDEKSLAPAF